MPNTTFLLDEAVDAELYFKCVHCGMCLESCPTYQLTGLESHSPRGRVYLIKAAAEGKMELNEFFANPINTCLDCRACETACPSNVSVGQLIEKTRGQLYQANPVTGWSLLIHHIFLHELFPFPTRLHKLQTLLSWYQKTGLQYLLRKVGFFHILPTHLRTMERALSISVPAVLHRMPTILPAIGTKRARVAVLTGCVMDVLYSYVNEATINVLRENGCEVWIPEDQTCCGALHVHAGDRSMAKILAKRNIEAFLSEEIDAIIINAAGCGSTLKEYEALFFEEEFNEDKVREFTKKVKDVSEYLFQLGLIVPKGRLNLTLMYHDACHLAHAQKIRVQPRKLLESIPGIQLKPMIDADACCGSAGIYNLTNPMTAGELLQRKMQNIADHCDAIVMGNPGCMMQFQVGMMIENRTEKIVYTIQVLDWAYKGINPIVDNQRGESDG